MTRFTNDNESIAVRDDYPQRVLDAMQVSIVVLGESLSVRYMNPAAEVLLAVSLRQARGLPFPIFARCAQHIPLALQQCLSEGRHFTERETTLTLLGETIITVDLSVVPIGPPHDPTEMLIEMRQLDRQLRISRDELLLSQHQTSRQLTRNLAHEIKNPLGGLRGAAQLLEKELKEEALKEYTAIIIGEADRLRNLVDRMLGPSRPPDHAEINVHEILERVRNLVLAENNPDLYIAKDYDPSIPSLHGDADRLIQAILNIVRNAVQAIEGRGTILLRTRIQRQCTIGQKRHKLVARIEIIDSGPGIPERLRENIFYPMISGHTQGTGLGLPIAQILVNQHGGLIEFASRPGETVFILLLPLEDHDG